MAVVQTQDWASVVSKELIATLDSKEIARQSIIYEIISGEQEYVQDLDDFEKVRTNISICRRSDVDLRLMSLHHVTLAFHHAYQTIQPALHPSQSIGEFLGQGSFECTGGSRS